jgi:hypothetical protein
MTPDSFFRTISLPCDPSWLWGGSQAFHSRRAINPVRRSGILFARHGLEVTLADISSTLLGFSQWRLDGRQLPTTYIDLKVGRLPHHAFDFVTAMDVFEIWWILWRQSSISGTL